jgi:hypothetical protein
MKALFKRNLKQTAVYWGNPDQDQYGNMTFDAPVQIKVRWEKKLQLFVDDKGQEITSVAIAFTDSELTTEGELMLGDLNDLESNGEPVAGFEQYKIRAVEAMPNKSNRQTVYKCWLGRVRE